LSNKQIYVPNNTGDCETINVVTGRPCADDATIVPMDVRLCDSDVTIEATEVKADTPLITNVITTAATETSHTFAVTTKIFMIRTRTLDKFQYGWGVGDSATNYVTVYRNGVLSREGLNTSVGLTIYFQTDKNNVMEIEEWS